MTINTETLKQTYIQTIKKINLALQENDLALQCIHKLLDETKGAPLKVTEFELVYVVDDVEVPETLVAEFKEKIPTLEQDKKELEMVLETYVSGLNALTLIEQIEDNA